MLVVLSGGGTAGHINPALALAEVLEERGCEVRFAGTPEGVEARLAREAGIPFKAFEVSGFDRKHPTTGLKALNLLRKSTPLAVSWFNEIKPDVVVAFGGYVCVPVSRAAEKMGIPLVVHEQNSVMGIANKNLAKNAARICLTYEAAASDLSDTSNVVVTGNPVRKSIFDATREQGRAYLGIPDDALMLLVFGGSQGARHINQGIVALKDKLLSYPDLYIVHVTGPKELESVESALSLSPEEAKRWMLFGYQNQMGACMAAADAIIARAGATSLAEISARAIPALLIPFPRATADHQTMNARSYVEAGCALMMPDDQVETDAFEQNVCRLIEDADLRAHMTACAKQQKTVDAARLLADEVMAVAQNRA